MVEFNKIKVSAIAALIVAPAMMFSAEMSLEECQAMAAKGNAEAQWQLGQRYESGNGIKKNTTRALAQYKKAAEQRHSKACSKLAQFYESGTFVRKDPVLAAKYRAWAEGSNGELAAAQARSAVERDKEDSIETALDYILGRNGKPKDTKTGIRILYQSAHDKPIAQKVFVDRWSKGDLDSALEVLDDEEWEKILPWFKNAWNNGNKSTGLVLGNAAYYRKQYSQALEYWKGSGLPKAWYFVGRFYSNWCEEGSGGGPLSMRDETKARMAYERCLKLDSSYDEARFNLGLVYLFAKKRENLNIAEAKKVFSYFLKKEPNDMWFNYDYGLAGYLLEAEKFEKKWPKSKTEPLLSWLSSHAGNSDYSMSGYDSRMMRECERMHADWSAAKKAQEGFVVYIRKAASLGCEPAQEFMSDYNSDANSK